MRELSQTSEALAALGDGAFFTAGDASAANTMTIGWGTIGIMWGKPVFVAVVRPSRYTYEFVEKSGEFTVSLPRRGEMGEALGICGSVSGRDGDKFAAAGLTLQAGRAVSAPVIAGCGLYYECRVVGRQQLAPGDLSGDINAAWYAEGNHHTVYYGEIVAAYSG